MPKTHVVAAGDCIASIGFRYGFFPGTLWDHAENVALKDLRGDGNVLEPGDGVHIPDRVAKTVPCGTGRQHVFRRRGVPEVLKLQLVRLGEPRAQVAYRLEIDGKTVGEGTTDGEGRLEHFIPPNAQSGVLIVSEQEIYQLELGRMRPASTDAGAHARLVNLGYLDAGEDDAALFQALTLFQRDHELAVTGTLDDTTRAKLVEIHGR